MVDLIEPGRERVPKKASQSATTLTVAGDAHPGDFGFKRSGFYVKKFGRPAFAADAVVGLLERRKDVVALGLLERLGRGGRLNYGGPGKVGT